jgi:hypothetical protein
VGPVISDQVISNQKRGKEKPVRLGNPQGRGWPVEGGWSSLIRFNDDWSLITGFYWSLMINGERNEN